MKVKLDENLPSDLATLLAGQGFAVDTVADEGLVGCADEQIWAAAQADERFLVTQDLDFADARKFRAGTHAGIMIVRLRDPSRRSLVDCIGAVLRGNDLRDWSGCLVVLSDSRLRVLRPDGK